MAYSANTTKFFYVDPASITQLKPDGDNTEIKLLMEIPELGCTAEKIDVTTLSDSTKQYLRGTKDYGDLVFKFMYENKDATSNYRILKKLDNDGIPVTFKLRYPDEKVHEFKAVPTVKMDAGTLNGALTFTATMVIKGEIVDGKPVTLPQA